MSQDKNRGGSFLGAAIGWMVGGPIGAFAGYKFGRQVFDAALPQIERALQHYEQLSPSEKSNLLNGLTKMQQQYDQMNALSQQRYEARVSAIHGMAASNGIDWSPP